VGELERPRAGEGDVRLRVLRPAEGKTADEKRTAAFKKWAEWEKANPEKIKAKPPEKKDK
jgi:hypothetical protein